MVLACWAAWIGVAEYVMADEGGGGGVTSPTLARVHASTAQTAGPTREGRVLVVRSAVS